MESGSYEKKPPPQLKRIRDQHSRCFEPCVLCSALADKTQVLTAALVGVTTQRKNDFAFGLDPVHYTSGPCVERVSKSRLGLPAYIYFYTQRDDICSVSDNGVDLVILGDFCRQTGNSPYDRGYPKMHALIVHCQQQIPPLK